MLKVAVLHSMQPSVQHNKHDVSQLLLRSNTISIFNIHTR